MCWKTMKTSHILKIFTILTQTPNFYNNSLEMFVKRVVMRNKYILPHLK